MNNKYSEKYARLPRINAAQVGRPVFRHRNPLVGGRLYIFDQPIYDVYIVAIATATNEQVLFTIPRGQQFTPPGGAAFTKTAYHTWLTQAGQLAAPQKHVTRAISLAVRGNITPNDLNRLLFQSLVRLTIDQMDFATVLAQHLGGGGGAFSGAAAGIVVNGLPVCSNIYHLDPSGETIEQQQNFSVTISPQLFNDGLGAAGAFTTDAAAATPPGTGIVAWLALEGQLARAVQ
ncbi:MAG: hypothetical protein L0212_04150 [Acidobacteria bacterium]|nr:hypothetical protein [Acidobacteriota bacterium]